MNPSEAEEHLRIIRSLMERATIYRAISAPTALVGGLVSIGVGTALHFSSNPTTRDYEGKAAMLFLAAWGAVLLVTGLVNVWFLAREARRRGEALFSPAMAKAMRALSPAFLTAAVFTVLFGSGGAFIMLPTIWMICYGLALLSAAQFSPQAIPRLGWAFLIGGLISAVVIFGPFDQKNVVLTAPHLLMAITFGGFHLLYAVCTWTTQEKELAAHV